MKTSPGDEIRERNRDLWVLAASPGIWAAHLLLAYALAAIWCAKRGFSQDPIALTQVSLYPVRITIAALTALGRVVIVGRSPC